MFLLRCEISCSQSPQPDSSYIKENYVKAEYRILMRDGKRLFTTVYYPRDSSQDFPFMLNRTPYSVAPYGPKYKTHLGPSSWFVRDKYIFVDQDVRGRWMSEGVFQEMTPEKDRHNGKLDVDEGTDTYDTIDWLVRNIRHNNGKVGVLWDILSRFLYNCVPFKPPSRSCLCLATSTYGPIFTATMPFTTERSCSLEISVSIHSSQIARMTGLHSAPAPSLKQVPRTVTISTSAWRL